MRRWQIPSSCRMRQLPQGSSFQAAEAQSMLFLRATNSKGFVACSPTLAKALSSAQAELPAKVCLHVCWSKNWRAVGTSRLSRVSIYLSIYVSIYSSIYLSFYLSSICACLLYTHIFIYIYIYIYIYAQYILIAWCLHEVYAVDIASPCPWIEAKGFHQCKLSNYAYRIQSF